MFSIIVPIYGVEQYLNQCVDSILNQSFLDFELILVDDGSKDGCPEICDEYESGDARVKVIHKENGGLVSARKAGCLAAEGRYIINVDGDDWLEDGALQSLFEVVQSYNPDVICYGYYEASDGKKKPVQYQYDKGIYSKADLVTKIYPELILSEKGAYFPPSIWSKTVKRELYVECQMLVDDKVKIGEDVCCAKPIVFLADTLYIMPYCLYDYRQNRQSMTKNGSAFSMLTPQLVFSRFSECFKESPEMSEQIDRCCFQLFFNAALSQFNRDDSYSGIIRDIKDEMSKDYLRGVLKRCRYDKSFTKGQVALFLLRHKLFFGMKCANVIFKHDIVKRCLVVGYRYGNKMNDELKEIIEEDRGYYYGHGARYLYRLLTHNPLRQRGRYVITCRKLGYHSAQKGILSKALTIVYTRQKNVLGQRLHIELGPNVFGRGLRIYHDDVVVNAGAVIGDNCELHGNNCLGNKRSLSDPLVAPTVGNNVCFGVGACAIGGVSIADNTVVSSMSLVNKDIEEPGGLWGGMPAKRIR